MYETGRNQTTACQSDSLPGVTNDAFSAIALSKQDFYTESTSTAIAQIKITNYFAAAHRVSTTCPTTPFTGPNPWIRRTVTDRGVCPP